MEVWAASATPHCVAAPELARVFTVAAGVFGAWGEGVTDLEQLGGDAEGDFVGVVGSDGFADGAKKRNNRAGRRKL